MVFTMKPSKVVDFYIFLGNEKNSFYILFLFQLENGVADYPLFFFGCYKLLMVWQPFY